MKQVQNSIFVVVMIILAIVIIWAIYRYIKLYKQEHFVCPKCGYSWKPPVLKMIFATNAVEGKIIRRKNCNAKSYIEPTKDCTI